MPSAAHADNQELPRRFEELVRMMPPQAIVDDVHYENSLAMIDRLMASGRLTSGQALYMETLVQLVRAFEADRYAIETADLIGLDCLKHLMDANNMNASGLARLLGVHQSMGSKILKGERSLTVEHLRKLAEHFKVGPQLFMG